MNYELKRKKRWFRALEIAESLFEDEGYHTEYLKDLREFLKGEGNVFTKNKRGSHSKTLPSSKRKGHINDKTGR